MSINQEIEIEQLSATIRDQDYENEKLQARVAELESFINQAPVETGVCMCGEEMYRHGSQPNHTPMDSWDYERDLILRDEAEILTEVAETGWSENQR